MAGAINNATLLAALNQSIQAINDLVTALSAKTLEVTVQSATPDVFCTPTVTVNCSCGCSASAGTTLDGPSGDQGQTPPTGYTEPDPNTTDRKCKVANMIHDSTLLLVHKLAVMDADAYANVGFVMTATLVGAALGSVVPGLGTLVGGVVGAIAGIATNLVTGGALLDLSDLGLLLDDHASDLVNALYNATTASGARSAYLDILTDNGATAIERAIIEYALPNDLLNLLFFTLPSIEPTIDGYSGAVNCVENVVTAWHFDDGAEGWVHSIAAGAQWEVEAGWRDDATPAPDGLDTSAGFLRQECAKTLNTPSYEAWFTRDVSGMAITAHEGDQFKMDTWYTSSDHAGFYLKIVYSDDTTDVTYLPNVTAQTWAQYSVTVTAGNDGKTVKALAVNGHVGEASGAWVFGFDRALWVEA